MKSVSLIILTAAFLPFSSMTQSPAVAQTAGQPANQTYSIPAQSLSTALLQFANQTGLQLFYDSSVISGKRSPGVSGSMSRQAALQRILSGSGLAYRFTNATTVAISDPRDASSGAADADGTLLGVITVDVDGGQSTVYTPYETAGPTDFISEQEIERFRGSSPADLFVGTPGVSSGEARNGGGSVDINIRGMQGFGRVYTTVDGAENQLSVYQGYQGVSNRSFLDPDFLAGIDITKGASTDKWGNAGSVAMRTFNAEDIVKPGETWGFRVRGGVGTNTGEAPVAGNLSGLAFENSLSRIGNPEGKVGTATPSETGLDRPDWFRPTQGSASVLAARKGEHFDFLAGYAHRKRNNYFAGTNGPTVEPELIGPQPGPPGFFYENFIQNGALTNYRAGEEVLNTALETRSWLFKLTPHLGDDKNLTFGYNRVRIESGERLASREASRNGQTVQQAQDSATNLDTFTAQYEWDPVDNDLIYLKSNFFWNHLEQLNPNRISFGTGMFVPVDGLAEDFRVGTIVDNWGYNLSNLSHIEMDAGDLDLTYGLNYRGEQLRTSEFFDALSVLFDPGKANRHELAGFLEAAYTPVDWLTLDGGLRYSHYWMNDRRDTPRKFLERSGGPTGFKTDDGGISPSAGITVTPFDGAQFYVDYSNALRYPSLFESAFTGGVIVDFAQKPEQSRNWELGLNLIGDDVLAEGDRAMAKFGYFNWDVNDYLARRVQDDAIAIVNIDRARFEGLEFSGRYEVNGFTADLAANYYLNIEYCETANTCAASTLYGDYATNHVPPEYEVSLTLSQELFDDLLTVGGRVRHVGPRPIDAGEVTGTGLLPFIRPIEWEPFTVVDLFSELKLNDNLTAAFRVENLFDEFYVDPLSLVTKPAPGRTFYASLTAEVGGDATTSGPFLPFLDVLDNGNRWSGFHAGVHAGGVYGRQWGDTTSLDGTFNELAALESPDFISRSSLMGGQIGYGWQFNNGLVLGFEADWSKTYMRKKEEIFAGPTDDPALTDGEEVAILNYKIDWVSEISGKIGYALTDNILVYATGGLALQNGTTGREQYVQTNNNGFETSILSVDKGTSFTRRGFTVGGGLEYAIDDRWSIAANYSYSRFRPKKIKLKKASAGGARQSSGKVVGQEERFTTLLPEASCQWLLTLIGNPLFPWLTQDYWNSQCLPRNIVFDVLERPLSEIKNGRQEEARFETHAFKIKLNYKF